MRIQKSLMARMGGALLLAGALVVTNATQADAALMVWVCNDASCSGGAPDVFVTDGGAGDLNPGTAGQITVALPGGSIEIAASYPFLGSASQPVLNLAYALGSTDFATYGPTPYIYVAQDGFTLFPGAMTFVANASNGNGTAKGFAGAGVFAPPGLAGDTKVDCLMPCSGGAAVPAAPYYLAIGLQLTAGAGGGASGDATITVVPEPASMALFGLGLAGVGLMSRRRRARQ